MSGTPRFWVFIRNGDFLLYTQCCPTVPIVLQGDTFTIDLFVLPIEGPDVVLGIQWLQLVGRISHDYLESTMEFWKDGAHVLLTGTEGVTPTPISLHLFQTLFHNNNVQSLCELQAYSIFLIDSNYTPESNPPNLPSSLRWDSLLVDKHIITSISSLAQSLSMFDLIGILIIKKQRLNGWFMKC